MDHEKLHLLQGLAEVIDLIAGQDWWFFRGPSRHSQGADAIADAAQCKICISSNTVVAPIHIVGHLGSHGFEGLPNERAKK